MTSFLLLGLLQTLVFFLLIYKHPLKEPIDRYLVILFIGGALSILSKVFLYQIRPDEDIRPTISSTLCFAAMSYLFIREYLTGRLIPNKVIFFHALPFFFSIAVYAYELLTYYEILKESASIDHYLVPIERHMRTFFLIVYLIPELILIYKHRDRITRQKHINNQISFYFVFHTFLILALTALSAGSEIIQPYILFIGFTSIPALFVVILYFKHFLGVKHLLLEFHNARNLPPYLPDETTAALPPAEPADKYAKTNLNDKKYEAYCKRVSAYLQDERPYLNLDFSMADFAEAVQLSHHDLSLVINNYLHSNFYTLINTLRIEYFLRHFAKVARQEKSILELSYESGFNSKSTFNKYFRQVTGLSPTEYQKQYRKGSSK